MAAETPQPSTDLELDIQTINLLRQRFLEVQAGRLARVRHGLQHQQQICVNLLPLLLHISDSTLPGFNAEDTPAGISGYSPDPQTLKLARQYSRQFSGHAPPRHLAPDIVALFFMGSSGSIAQSVRSDLDLWVCYRSHITDAALAQLQDKCERIEAWARRYNLELHLFLMNADSFRGGERETLNGEYCGSSQHYLLLDEFYRTGIHLAGATPAWWYVPPHLEHRYDEVVAELYRSGKVQEHSVVDFGRIDHMPLGEFLGAAMWQLYKGIDSPWKSLLKLLLLECYLHDEQKSRGMLCQEFKQHIYEDEPVLDVLDPYIMMYRRLELYLEEKGQPARLELVRQCLYQKIGIALSRPLSRGRTTWRRELLTNLVREWDWSGGELALLDQRDNWGIEQALAERQSIMREFTQSYRNMSRFAQELGGQAVMTRADMLVLGRKLHASFDRKPGKIDIINEDTAPNLSQEKITLHQLATREQGQYLWAAYVDLPTTRLDKYPPPLKQARGFIEVLLWCHLNGLLTGHLHVPVYTQRSHLIDFEVKELMSTFRQSLPHPMPSAPQQAFRKPSRIEKIMLYVNVGVDPMSSLSRRGLQKISSRIDSLDYSALGENLVRTLDMVSVSNWHEVVCTRYSTNDALVQMLQALFTRLHRQPEAPVPEIEVHCFCPSRATATAQRVQELLHDMLDIYCRQPEAEDCRYLMRIEQTYYLCQFSEGRFYAEAGDGLRQLYPMLAREQRRFSPLVLDRNAMHRNPALRLILEMAKPGQIMVCFQADSRHIAYWVTDEMGSMFHARVPNHGVSNLLNHLYRFLRNVELQQMTAGGNEIDLDLILSRRRIHFFQLKRPTVKRPPQLLHWPGAEDDELDAIRLQVMLHRSLKEELHYQIYVGQEEFSSLVLGPDLFPQVVERIMELRADNARYPCYISDLRFSEELLAGFFDGNAQTVHYLQYKQRLERRLNHYLNPPAPEPDSEAGTRPDN
ncbi:class I adenylate cyclase [Natronospirillum operosum]|nr:class I adenylate cyclase [Natronospirillum operosum]